MKTLIIEDELPAAELIVAYLKDYPNIQNTGIFNDGFSGLKAIQESSPDIVFLDVQMPKLNGFEMLELIETPPIIVFTTAFDEYAIKAFDMNAADYLLKPFSKQRFSEAIDKAVKRLELKKTSSTLGLEDNVIDFLPPGKIIERIVVKNNARITILPVHEVSHIEAWDDYVIVHSNGQKHLKQKTMKYYEDHLQLNRFIRIHRSFIVNVDFIDQIMLWEKETYMVKLKNGTELRASRSGYKKLKEIF